MPVGPLLATDSLRVQFGGVTAVQDVTLSVYEGQIVSLIGPNGAGKTTIINAVTGFVRSASGAVWFSGNEITGRRPEHIAQMGLVRTFQNAAMFASMSVTENLSTGRFLKTKTGVVQTLLRTRTFHEQECETQRQLEEVLKLVGLQHKRELVAGELPYGDQRGLGVGIALMASPQLLVLDEPAAGLSSEEARIMGDLILRIRRDGTTILLIEHNMSVVMSISDHVIVLNHGQKMAEGNPETIRRHPDVVEAYLGAEP